MKKLSEVFKDPGWTFIIGVMLGLLAGIFLMMALASEARAVPPETPKPEFKVEFGIGREIFRTTPTHSFIFYKDEKVGVLSWGNGILEFEGNIKESALQFIIYLKTFVDKYIEENIVKDIVIMTGPYKDGVNDALDTISLLALELRLKGESKTWGEMDDIVRERLKVRKEE